MRRRRRRVPRSAWLSWAAVLCGVVAGVLVLASGRSPAATTGVLVARERIPAGTLVDAGLIETSLATVPVPSDLALGGLVADATRAEGRRTTGTLMPGEPLTVAVLGGGDGSVTPLAPGERAVPVPASAAGGGAAGLAPGMRVDVVASTGEGAVGRTYVVVADAEILSVDPAAGTPAGLDAANGPSVVLRASARDALSITSALNFAREVRLLVRPGEERGTTPPAQVEVTP